MDDAPCWIWTGGRTAAGYGQIHADGRKPTRYDPERYRQIMADPVKAAERRDRARIAAAKRRARKRES